MPTEETKPEVAAPTTDEEKKQVSYLTDDAGNPSSSRVVSVIFAVNSVILSWVCCSLLFFGFVYSVDVHESIVYEMTLWFAGLATLGKSAQKFIELRWGKK